MTNLNPRRNRCGLATGLVLVLALVACRSLEAGVIVATSLSLTQMQILPPGAMPGSYSFTDFGGCCYQATLVTISVTGTSTGEMQLNTNSTPDYSSVGGGDRLLLSLTNNSGVAFNGITLLLGGTAFDLEDGIDPSRGTFSSTYTSDPAQRLPGGDASINSPTDTNLIFTFDSTLASGGTTYFYLPILDNGSLANDNFDLSETPTLAGAVPEPTMIVPLGLALIGLAGLRRRLGR